MNTKIKGNKAEGVLLSEFVKREIPVSLPFGDNEPYDMVIEIGGQLKKVQVKSGCLQNGCVIVYIKKKIGFKRVKYETYQDKVDYVGVWCEELNESYLIPNKFLNKTHLHLRVNTPKNNYPSSLILWAKDFYLDNILAKNK